MQSNANKQEIKAAQNIAQQCTPQHITLARPAPCAVVVAIREPQNELLAVRSVLEVEGEHTRGTARDDIWLITPWPVPTCVCGGAGEWGSAAPHHRRCQVRTTPSAGGSTHMHGARRTVHAHERHNVPYSQTQTSFLQVPWSVQEFTQPLLLQAGPCQPE